MGRYPSSDAALRNPITGNLAMSKAGTSRSNIAGRTIKSIGCRRWLPLWFNATCG
jgi:hypothetical protein